MVQTLDIVEGTQKLNQCRTSGPPDTITGEDAENILSLLELVKFARSESLRLGLEFEAYLLDMAALELADRYEER